MPTPTAGQFVKILDSFDDRTWTPAYSNVTLGSGAVNEGRWRQQGNFVVWQFRTQFGTSPSFASTIQLTLPVVAWPGGGNSLQMAIGSWVFRQSSIPAHYAGTIGVWDAGGTQGSFSGAWSLGAGTPKPDTRINATQPFTVAAGDVLSGSGQYAVS